MMILLGRVGTYTCIFRFGLATDGLNEVAAGVMTGGVRDSLAEMQLNAI